MGNIKKVAVRTAKTTGAAVAVAATSAGAFYGTKEATKVATEKVIKPALRKAGGTKVIKEKGFLGVPKKTEIYAWTNERVKDVLKKK